MQAGDLGEPGGRRGERFTEEGAADGRRAVELVKVWKEALCCLWDCEHIPGLTEPTSTTGKVGECY